MTQEAPNTENSYQVLIAEAKKFTFEKQYELAVERYGKALDLMVTQHGQLAPECADTYLLYGEALLENAINQNSILGNEAAKNMQSMNVTDNGARKIIHFEGEAFDDVEEEVAGEDEEEEDSEGKEEASKEGELQNDEPKDEEEEDDFSVAWEVLDVARLIYSNSKETASQLKLADVYLLLGDLSMETENFEQAIKDYTECCQIRTANLASDDRRIAEVYYKMCMTFEYSGKKEDAVSSVLKCLEVLNLRKEKLLNSNGKGKEKLNIEDASEVELADLNELIPDLECKLEDLKPTPAVNNTNENFNQLQTSNTPAANDLTGLVKRKVVEKRKLEEEKALEND